MRDRKRRSNDVASVVLNVIHRPHQPQGEGVPNYIPALDALGEWRRT